jgi:hypothetical protein
MRWTASFVVLLLASAVVLAWPEALEGRILFQFSAEHGLTMSDVVGGVPVSIGWGVWLAGMWRRRARVQESIAAAPGLATIGAFVAGLGAGLLLATTRISFWWLAIGVALLTAAAISLAPVLSRRVPPRRPPAPTDVE